MAADAASAGLEADSELLSLAADAAGAWACDAASRSLYLSLRARAVLGLERRPQVSIDDVLAAIDSDDRPLLEHALLARDPSLTPFAIDARIDGRRLRFDGSVVVRGGVTRTAGSVIDVTARRAEEDRLRFHANQLRVVADGVAILISYVDRELRYRFANGAYKRWFGLPVERIVGSHVRDLLGEAGFAQVEAHLQRALGGLEARFSATVPFRDGSVHHVEAIYTPDFDERGDVRGIFAAVTDVTELKNAEREANESRALLQAVVDGSPTSIFVKDAEGRYLLVNPVARRLMGPEGDRVVGATDLDIFAPDVARTLRANDLRVMESGRMAACEESFRTPGGEVRTFITVKSPLRDDARGVYGLCGVALDITDRKQAEEALRASNDRFSKAFRCSPCPMTITTLGEGRYVDVNEAYVAMTGFRRDDVVGRTAVEMGLWTAAEREQFVAPLRDGQPLREIPMHYRTQDGRPLELLISTEIIELDGQRCLLSAVRDETRQRRMIEALRHSEEASDARAKELAAVLEATPAAIWIAHDVDCKVVTGSRAGRAMLRAAPLENLSKSSDEAGRLAHFKVLRHGRELAPEELPLQRAARGETIRDFEEEIVFETGERRHLLGDAVPMHDAQGRLRGAVAAFIDVTRLRETTVELREGAKRKDEFLALLGHELRSPLSAIQSSAHLLAGMTGGNDHLARVAGIVRRQSEQLARLVDDLLDVSRITHGKIAIHKEDIPLRAIVDRAVEASRHLIDSGAHALEIRVDDESLRVQGDLARLSQVVCNLLNNAARYTPRGGHIRLEAQRRGEWIRVAVADDGIGLAPEALERIFQLFEQAHEVRSRSMGGLGVGLALARALVELHGGRITARSDGLGRGSEFEVLLPVS